MKLDFYLAPLRESHSLFKRINWSEADHILLRDHLLLSEICFEIGTNDFSPNGWVVPIFDFAGGLYEASVILQKASEYKFDFLSDSSHGILFKKVNSALEVSADYCSAVSTIELEELVTGSQFFAREVYDILALYFPGLSSNKTFKLWYPMLEDLDDLHFWKHRPI